MPEIFPWLLFLHVMAAIVAFGPTYAFSIIGAMGGKEPQHANFATRVSNRVGDVLVTPFALSMPVTGALMIWAAEIPLFQRDTRWLLLAIILYVVALGLSFGVAQPNVRRIIALSGGEGGSAAGPSGSPPGPPPGPPPAELLKAVGIVQRSGMALGLLVGVIVFLMVVKPDLGF